VSDLPAQLRRFKPVSLKAVLRDGTERPVAVPKSGNRWQRCMQTLDALDWEKVECLDKDGRVVGVVESPEDEYDEDGVGAEGDIHKLARIMLEVMRSTQKETRQMFEVQMRGQAELVAALIEGVRAVADSHSLAMKVQAASMVTTGDAEGDNEVMNMLKMAMMYQMQGKQAPGLPMKRPNPMPPRQPQPQPQPPQGGKP